MTPVPAATSKGKILVVDDNPIIQRAVFFQLRDQGYNVLMCGDITEAMNLTRKERPDVVILDINFPGEEALRDGFWATKWLHKMEEAKNTPVILISTSDPVETEPRALAAGAAAFLPKPLDQNKLLATIEKSMAGKKPVAPNTSSLKMAS